MHTNHLDRLENDEKNDFFFVALNFNTFESMLIYFRSIFNKIKKSQVNLDQVKVVTLSFFLTFCFLKISESYNFVKKKNVFFFENSNF